MKSGYINANIKRKKKNEKKRKPKQTNSYWVDVEEIVSVLWYNRMEYNILFHQQQSSYFATLLFFKNYIQSVSSSSTTRHPNLNYLRHIPLWCLKQNDVFIHLSQCFQFFFFFSYYHKLQFWYMIGYYVFILVQEQNSISHLIFFFVLQNLDFIDKIWC